MCGSCNPSSKGWRSRTHCVACCLVAIAKFSRASPSRQEGVATPLLTAETGFVEFQLESVKSKFPARTCRRRLISNRILDQATPGTEEVFRPMCSSYATLYLSNRTSANHGPWPESSFVSKQNASGFGLEQRPLAQMQALRPRVVYDPRIAGAGSFAAFSLAAASLAANSLAAFAAAERAPRPESRLNWRIL
jgi:hypothetical protein